MVTRRPLTVLDDDEINASIEAEITRRKLADTVETILSVVGYVAAAEFYRPIGSPPPIFHWPNPDEPTRPICCRTGGRWLSDLAEGPVERWSPWSRAVDPAAVPPEQRCGHHRCRALWAAFDTLDTPAPGYVPVLAS